MLLNAHWIWHNQDDANPYNQTVIARRYFHIESVARAVVEVTADSYYRLCINGEWVNDGPCRSWPEHYQYDRIDVTGYVQPGRNEIRLVARYYGEGNHHQVPQQAGLLFEMNVTPVSGEPFTLVSDDTWEVALAEAWVANTPLISLQMEPFEQYDARREDRLHFDKAVTLSRAHDGPWKDLDPRDSALLTRRLFRLRRFVGAGVVDPEWLGFTFPVKRLLHPGLRQANHHVSVANAVATLVVPEGARTIRIESDDYHIKINGAPDSGQGFSLSPGKNLLVAVSKQCFGHSAANQSIRFVDCNGFALQNPREPEHPNPWCFVPAEDQPYVGDDMIFNFYPDAERDRAREQAEDVLDRMQKEVVDVDSFSRILGARARCIPPERMLQEDPHAQFLARHVIGDAAGFVDNPEALMRESPEMTVVRPSPQGDIEIVYDLGQQNCGYYAIDIESDAECVIDVFGIEHIREDGVLQHTWGNRNGVRYICKQGANRFVSLKRRSGRYLFITLRNQTKPVRIRNIHLIESTYPAERQGAFSCSDFTLNQIWEMSAHTLKLCIEDTYTDCPLYEQTLWVGDARNEALFAYTAFGATDVARRCITLAAQSLERYPIVGCQVPSSWDVLIPAWSFLWVISVWEHYFYSGDKAFLAKTWESVCQNLRGAETFIDDSGLFSARLWNMFDWSGIDDRHETVLHNSLFAVGAVDAALACADVLEDAQAAVWLQAYRDRLVHAINQQWDETWQAYPDSIHEDGTPSPSVSQHTSFLAILYDVVEASRLDAALQNLLDPPEGMITVGSPFAMLYAWEALEKTGMEDAIIASIRRHYLPMVNAGASTVWEVFPGGAGAPPGFPTRSHCHAWSSAPIHFLNRIILGIRQTRVGGAAYEISPRLNGLTWARGASATIKGPIEVEWQKKSGQLYATVAAPEGTSVKFVKNETHDGITVWLNGRRVDATSVVS